MTTLYQQHVTKWSDCQLCSLSKCRSRVVIARGSIPAEILFVGEAPGASEDVVGQPFVGPAGRLLDHIILRSLEERCAYAMTNLVCCLPKDVSNAKGEPPKEAVMACRPRLLEFIGICKPQLIVAVGLLSQRSVPNPEDVARANLIHPAAILRMDASQQALAIKRCIVTVRDAVATYL